MIINGLLNIGLARTVRITSPISEGQFADSSEIEEVIFAEDCGVTVIPDYAFLGCTSLKRVVLPPSLKKIGFQAFSECSALESVNLPESLVDIGSNAFAYCRSLDNLTFPAALRHIGHNAFSFCESLTEAILPDSIEELESYAFSDCRSLRKAKLPANGNLLGELIFNCCESLTELQQPSPVVPKFDCLSFIFDPLDTAAYRRCHLRVPAPSLTNYKFAQGWSLFPGISPL